jgi:hypothetical protein
MAFGTWTNGNQLGATDVNSKIMQSLFITKTTDESVTSSTTMQNDNVILFTTITNSTYFIKAYIMVDGHDGATGGSGTDGAGGIEYGWYGPTNATFNWTSNAITDDTNARGNVSRIRHTMGSLPDMMTIGTGNYMIIPVEGILQTTDTGGTFGFRWTQATSNATPTVVKALSGMIVLKLV